MHKSQLAGFIIDCQTDDIDRAAAFWSAALGLEASVDPDPEESVQRAAAAIAEGVDLDRLLAVAQWSPELELMPAESAVDQVSVTVAYLEGEAFSFYYAENLERLRAAGVQLVPVDPANASELPQHCRQDPLVSVVVDLHRRVEARLHLERLRLSRARVGGLTAMHRGR